MRDLLESVPPHSLDAERAVIGACFHIEGGFELAKDALEATSFYHEPHAALWRIFVRLRDRGYPLNLVTVEDLVGEEAIPSLGGWEYLEELADWECRPLESQVEGYIRIVVDRAHLRSLRHAGAKISELTFDTSATGQEAHAQALRILDNIDTPTPDIDGGPQELGSFYLAELEARAVRRTETRTYLETGWHDVDDNLGIGRGDLVFIAARPGMGKTAWVLSLAWNVAQYARVLFFSLEMARDRLMDRLMLGMTDIESKKLASGDLTPQDWEAVTAASQRVMDSGLTMLKPSTLTSSDVRRIAFKQATKGKPPALIVIDYLQLMNLPKADRHDLALGAVTRDLKKLAGELGCAVIALSQLNRGVESRPNKRPLLSDLKDSGSIEADADVVLMLYRDDYYAEKESRASEKPGICEIDIAKYRNGQSRVLELKFEAKKQLFLDYHGSFGELAGAS